METPKRTQRGLRGLRWLLSVSGLLVLFLFLARIDFDEFASTFSDLRWSFVVQAVACSAFNVALKAARWRSMVYRATGAKLGWGQALTAVLAGVAGASLTPGRSFDAAKPLMLRLSHGVPVHRGVSVVLAERILDMLALLLVFFVALASTSHGSESLAGIDVPVGFVVLILLLLSSFFVMSVRVGLLRRWVARRFPHDRIVSFVGALHSAVEVMRRSAWRGSSVFYSLAAMLVEAARAHAVFRGFGLELPVTLVAFTFAASILVGLLALIPGGVGVTETSHAGLIMLFAPQVTEERVRAAILIDRLLSYYLLVILGALVLIATFRMRGVETREVASEGAPHVMSGATK